MGDAFDDVETVGEFVVEGLDALVPGMARMAEQFVFDEGDGAAHEAAGVVVGDAALGRGNDEVGGEGDGDEGTHRQKVEIEEQLGQAVAPAPPARHGNPEKRAQEAVFGPAVSSSHVC